ncbi:MAG TPA: iron-sulfur cluster assembly scaffold protein [Candidatus Aerophobetes bacterium]|uniref:Iron-sulfur cluster assembly scaffold protein n=1 Tax=Aerophobetes bacterium TaxID=2030807 RepID=A0A7V0QSD4_UNCAE|nr:iron-sulfur cluster assembly scaffold protein [Candidatus Aerophobetes bacterium]
MSLPYSKKVIDLFLNPKNVGEIPDPDALATEGSPACGDMVTVYLKVDKKTSRIKDIKFKSFGCASNIATASIVTEMAKGKTLEEAKRITWKEIVEELGGLPPVKIHCSILAVDALHAAIINYEEKHGLVKEKIPTDENLIKKRLRHVIDPNTGKDIVGSRLIESIRIKEGKITIVLNIDVDNQFANAIKEEILEKLKYRWDVKEIEILFHH